MKFNPTDKSVSIVGDIDFLLFGSSATLNTVYSLTDRVRNVNIALDEAVADLYKADPNHMWDDTTNVDFPIATTKLTSGLDHYTMLDSSLVVHRVRVKDAQGGWVTLTPRLRRQFTDTQLNATGTPSAYHKLAEAIFPLPVPDYGVDAGMELTFQRGGNHFVVGDTSKKPGFNSQFHQILSIKASKRYALANGMSEKVQMLTEMENNINKKMVEHYQLRSPDEKPGFRLKNSTQGTGL